MISTSHSCLCCGYRTLELPSGGTMQICPVCFWEDASGEDYWNGSNSVSLITAQRNFAEFATCEEEFLDAVRSPQLGEERSADWVSFDQLCLKVIEFTEDVFSDVKLGDGITIHQREAIDGYQSATEVENARLLDREIRWQDIADEKINHCGTTLTFLDPKSIRYHLPAFMRYALRVWQKFECFGNADSILYSLNSGPRSEGYHADSFLLLDSHQNEAVAAFLKFASLVDSIYGRDAQKGLDKGWGEWMPHFIPFPTNSSYS